MTEVEFTYSLNTQNDYPTEELWKFMDTLKGNSLVYQAYQRFFDTYKVNGTERTEQDYVEKLSTLQKKLDIISKKNPRLEVCGAVASGKTFWAKIIMDILHKLWWNVHRDTVENDISEDFDTRILSQLGYNRDSDFFKKNLRNIGYTTMRCFGQNGCHAAPFSNGTQLRAIKEQEFAGEDQWQRNPKRCPWIVIDTSWEQRMQNFVGRWAARDEGRVPYSVEISTEVKKHAWVSVIHNNGDLDKTSDDIFQFILKNKEYYHIQEDEKTIRKTINTVLLPVKVQNIIDAMKSKIIDTLIKQHSHLRFSHKNFQKQALSIRRNQNAWWFIENILSESWVSSELLHNIYNSYCTTFKFNKNITWQWQSFSKLWEKVLKPYHISDEVFTKIKTVLSSKNITKSDNKAYINAVCKKEFMELFKDDFSLKLLDFDPAYIQDLLIENFSQ